MDRCCYKCNKDLAIEPAIKGLRGLLCFPCRYKLDRAGGERFVIEIELYPVRMAAWKTEFEKDWKTRLRISNAFEFLSLLMIIGAGLTFVLLYLSIHLGNAQVILFLGAFLVVDLCVWFVFSFLAEACKGVAPPIMPNKNPIALTSEPKLLFDGNKDADVNPAFTNYRPTNSIDSKYPPDWDERRVKCFIRDGRRCRLCGNIKTIQAHHVIPRSRDGSHNLQNLITLCSDCHKQQEYYDHKSFIKHFQEPSPEDFELEEKVIKDSRSSQSSGN